MTDGESDYHSVKHLIEGEDLEKLRFASNIKIIDFRRPEDFHKAHIAGAINMWRTDIESNTYPYKGMMADRLKIEKRFSALGISNKDQLIIYDDNGACDASRLWWVLRYYGFYNTKILNGGLTSWKLENRSLTAEQTKHVASNFKLPVIQDVLLYAKLGDLERLKVDDGNVLLDTRTGDEFSGKRQKKGASRAGHIPNGILVDWAQTIEFNSTKKFKPYNTLLDLYLKNGITNDKEIYTYCHSGVRSAHTTFVLTQLLGYRHVKNYDGSWIEWSFHKELPIQQDITTTIFK